MADTFLHRHLAPPGPRAEPRAEVRTAPAPPPFARGPVLIGDLLSAPGGRPLLLTHWDAPRDSD